MLCVYNQKFISHTSRWNEQELFLFFYMKQSVLQCTTCTLYWSVLERERGLDGHYKTCTIVKNQTLGSVFNKGDTLALKFHFDVLQEVLHISLSL